MFQGINPRVRSASLTMVLCGALLLPLAMLVFPAAAMAGTTPAGQWIGEVKTPEGDKVDIHLTLEKSGSVWSGTLEDPTIGVTTVTDLKVSDTWISFTFKPESAPFPLHFTGSYIAGDDRVSGTFSLHGNSRFVKFKRVPGSEVVVLAAGEEPPEPSRLRHDYTFGLTGRFSYWAPLHVVQDDVYTLNDLTVGTLNFDATFKWMAADGFAVFARYYQGGHNYTDKPLKLEPFADLGITSETYLKLDGIEIGFMGYLGNTMMRNSKFNPYLTAAIGQTSWELNESGRGSEVVVDGLTPFEGDDMSVSFGIGTEYELTTKMALEFEWMWRYFLTEDEEKWSDTENVWSNTHAWGLSAGFTYGF